MERDVQNITCLKWFKRANRDVKPLSHGGDIRFPMQNRIDAIGRTNCSPIYSTHQKIYYLKCYLFRGKRNYILARFTENVMKRKRIHPTSGIKSAMAAYRMNIPNRY